MIIGVPPRDFIFEFISSDSKFKPCQDDEKMSYSAFVHMGLCMSHSWQLFPKKNFFKKNLIWKELPTV